jgi:sterol desaturase/sphingolipid hydroxylase (fatty acid hydroxylase superfamily)
VFASLVVYDLLFFVSHVAIHRVPWLYRVVHVKHHRRRVMRARETVALSVADEALDVACSIAALNVLHVHPLSRCEHACTLAHTAAASLPLWSAKDPKFGIS